MIGLSASFKITDGREPFDYVAATIDVNKYMQQVGRANRQKLMSYDTNETHQLKEAFITLGKSGQRGAAAGAKFAMCLLLLTVKIKLARAINYQLPKSTITDHLKDCFGFMVTS